MRHVTILLALGLVGCAASPTAGAPTTAGRGSSSAPATSIVEAVPAALEGRILLGNRDTFYLANADGSAVEQLAEPGQYCCLARISPDHSRILTMPGTDQIGAVTGGTLTLQQPHFDLLPVGDSTLNLVPQAWSPDGTRIAFEGWDDADPNRTGIYTSRIADGADMLRVTTVTSRAHDIPLDYSPDGQHLVFYRAVRAEPDFPIDTDGSLWVVNADGTDAHQLDTGTVRPWWWARWSPDGSTIVFGAERLQPTGGLWTIKPDGSSLTVLVRGSATQFPVSPVWSPDGNAVMFAMNPINDAFQHPDNEIDVINADGSHLNSVIVGPGYKRLSDWWKGP